MYRKRNLKKVKPPVSVVEQQMIERRAKRFAAPAKPKCLDRDKEDYFRRYYHCPKCGTFLASYHYGRAWTSNGLSEDRRTDCPDCGQKIDWSGVPLPTREED